MPSFPQPGTVTICEINRELVTADHLGDDQANETYAKILGTVFSPIPFESDSLLSTGAEQESVERRKGSLGILSAGLEALLSGSLRPLLQPADVKCLKDIDLHSVSWHNHKQILAFVSAPHQVTICDYNDSDGKLPCVLSHESQKDVKILEWRPNGGKTLSVACKGGICIWAASYPGNVPSVRSGVTSNPLSRGSVTRWTLVDFLQTSASYESSAFTIWDVSQGLATPIRRGLGGISLLKWSPSGDYFFSAKFDGTFYLWETNTWTSEPWSSKNGFVTGATWDPDGSMVLLSFSESSSLGSIHFTSKPPSLDAHLIPVELPEIKLLTDSRVIEKIAWDDASGERLAVSCRDGDELYKGLIAIFDVKRTPLISTSLVGFIRGPGDNPKPVAFSFHDKFKQGPLLSVCWSSGFCCTYPLIFRSNILA
ncbi:Transducin/WD40 repeat-like superfamily protein [Perilla frutescens var. hirtella]|uniref:Transducin/WD40 repeat-like superfamily protein n=1 Tax=Perilla frutescens var. hirtella TaxID=608512 RepID=A0AAD4J7I1_PERFH|nr:Transducin/WD40 repeat-like superfamily protein [Perilla frutescens var. hirtella]KAH6828658.1 Transducin/WD40 repeat-like superfamily protein [Perilla frutescens var. hirtella]